MLKKIFINILLIACLLYNSTAFSYELTADENEAINNVVEILQNGKAKNILIRELNKIGSIYNTDSRNYKIIQVLVEKLLEKSNAEVENIQSNREISNDKKYIALTFDDGPSKANTPLLLDILKEHNIKATFLVLGKNANNFPEIIKREYEEGHEIGSHSWNHPKLTNLDEEEIKKQVNDTDNKIREIIGKTPTLFRPPYGSHNAITDKIINRTILLWNVDSLDWKNKNVEKNIATIKSQVKEGSIILMHDIHKTTIDSIEGVIKMLQENGYDFLTISELLEHYQDKDFSHKTCFGGFNCK